MAARLNPKNALSVRERIKAEQLANLLEKDAFGKKELTAGQRDSAKYLLSQAIGMPPQMTDVNINGQIVTNDVSDRPLTAEEWAAQADSVVSNTGTAAPTH